MALTLTLRSRGATLVFITLAVFALPALAAETYRTHYRTVAVEGVKIFYREAGDPQAPAILLLHGFPSSSHMYRNLIPLLADRYRVVAPDLPGFGFSDAPDRSQFKYSFEHLTAVMNRFTELVGMDRFAVYVFDYGGPIGFRMALAHPERIAAIISQSGNAYEEGLGPGFANLKKVWAEPTEANRNTLRASLSPEANQRRYFTGVPEADLLVDYGTNVAQYPRYQEYLRTRQPPLLAIWGRNDPVFLPAGAEAFKRDLPDAEVELLDAGHFAIETHVTEIANAMRGFLDRHLPTRSIRPGFY
jgi:pimeloyl-ACP methyl ester carboxylesterase